VRTGGTGDVTDTRRLWTLQKATNVPTPILHRGHLYFANDSTAVAHCVDIKTGDFVYSERLIPNPEGIYASPILLGDRILYLGRGGQAVFIAAKPEFKVLSSPALENGRGMFNASPAVAGNHLLLRSNKFLYCIGDAPKP
jgi:outer membrane protein assembly factor BamB